MERTYTTDAIVLCSRDVREHDKQVTLLTDRFGKIELLARGTKKMKSKLNSHLEPLYRVRVMGARGRRGDKLAGSLLVRPHGRLRSELPRLAAGCYISEMTDRLLAAPHQEGETFGLCALALTLLDGDAPLSPSMVRLITSGYALKLLDLMGYRPEVYRCIRCYRGMLLSTNRFHLFSGGITCDRCAPLTLIEPYVDVSDEGIVSLRHLLDGPLEGAAAVACSARVLDEVETIIHKLLEVHTGRPLCAHRFIRYFTNQEAAVR